MKDLAESIVIQMKIVKNQAVAAESKILLVVGPMCCVNACKRTQCTYRKEKGFAPVFLAGLTAYCATAPCKPLHGA